MGTACHVLVSGGPQGTAAAVERVVATVSLLEARWSRFLASSDISRINAADGRPVAVSDETLLAVDLALAGRSRTGGRFDPTVLAALVQAGYDRDFAATAARSAAGAISAPGPGSPAAAAVALDLDAGTVAVAHGHGVDLGGVGKGLAADLAAAAALTAGAEGVCVNLGGDLRVAGDAPGPGGWGVVVDDPNRSATTLAIVGLAAGGLATSSTRRRRWRHAGGRGAHHVIDPVAGEPAATDLAAVTVIAASAADAEILATAALVAGAGAGLALLEGEGTAALLVTERRVVHRTASMQAYLR